MFWENFYNLCLSRGLKPVQVGRDLGIANGAFTAWKNGTMPSQKNLERLAQYFEVDVEYFFIDHKKSPILKSDIEYLAEKDIHLIPIFESTSAGFGTSAIDYVVDYMPMYLSSPDEARDTICVKVIGDSMSPKIEDGDIIQVHKQDSVDSGSIAVVLVNEESFVKKVVYGESWIELHSFNHAYRTMRFDGDKTSRVRVLGLVKRVIKNL